MSTATLTDLTAATPVDIDTRLADLYYAELTVRFELSNARESLYHVAGAQRLYGRGTPSWNMTDAEAEATAREYAADPARPSWTRRDAIRALDKVDTLRARLADLRADMAPLHAEYRRRGGWTRGFLVTDGHVHSSQQCSTCHNGEHPTAFTWLTEFSGKDEADVVAAAADRACTVCYPTAPVDTAGPSTLMTPDERTRAQQRADAQAARDRRTADRIAKGLTADGSEFQVSWIAQDAPGWERDAQGRQIHVRRPRERHERFKTERAATQWLVQQIAWGHGWYSDQAPAYQAIVDAVAAKHGQTPEQARADLEAKVAAKQRRDARG